MKREEERGPISCWLGVRWHQNLAGPQKQTPLNDVGISRSRPRISLLSSTTASNSVATTSGAAEPAFIAPSSHRKTYWPVDSTASPYIASVTSRAQALPAARSLTTDLGLRGKHSYQRNSRQVTTNRLLITTDRYFDRYFLFIRSYDRIVTPIKSLSYNFNFFLQCV